MNKDVVLLREKIKKLVPMISGRGLRVTQVGTRAYVSADPKTGIPARVNIPSIPDNAEKSFILAIEGFIDHEVAHVLFTDFKFKAGEKTPQLHNLHNIIEDTMIERLMAQKFRGTPKNISELRKHFLEKITAPSLETATTPEEQFSYLFVVAMRALAGHVEMQEFMDDGDHWKHPLIQALLSQIKPATLERLSKIRTTQESFEIAKEIHDILHPPKPPAPPAPPPEEEQQDDQSDDSSNAGDSDESAETPDEQSDEQSGEQPEGNDEEDGEDDAGGSSQADDEEDEDGQSEEADGKDGDDDEDHSDEEMSGDDGEGDGEREHKEDASSDNASGGEENDEEDLDEGEGSEADADGSAGDEEEPDESEESGSDDQGEPGEEASEDEAGDDDSGSAPGVDDQEKDAGDDGEDADDNSGAPADGDAEADGADGQPSTETLAVEIDSQTDDAADDLGDDRGDDDIDVAGVGYTGPNPFESAEIDLNEKDISSSISVLIQREVIEAMKEADYTVFTREFDVIEPLKVPDTFDPQYVVDLEEVTRSLTGVMQKDIERMMAAQSRTFNYGGRRSGRLNGPGLHRLVAGDARIFTQREEIRSKDTAVMLLNDCSGSMSGRKQATAMSASYALAQVLERVNIPCEVMGFTTGGGRYYRSPTDPCKTRDKGIDLYDQWEKESNKTGVVFSRVDPIYMPIFKEFTERLSADVKRRFAYQRSVQPNQHCNIDGESLEYAAMRLAKRPEKRKVIIVLSDGFPAGALGDREHLRMMTAKLQEGGFDLVGIGIESDAVERFYDKSLVLHSVTELPAAVMGQLRQILTK